MAEFNEILEGSLNQVLSRRLAMQGNAPAPALMPEVAPVLVLENDRPEWSFLKREAWAWGIGNAPANAGLRSGVKLTNPTGSGAIIVLKRSLVWCQAVCQFRRVPGVGAAPGPNVGTSAPEDLRYPSPAPGINTVGHVSWEHLPAPLAETIQVLDVQGPTVNYVVDHNVVLPPGSTVSWWGAANNFQVVVSFQWYERRALPGELG